MDQHATIADRMKQQEIKKWSAKKASAKKSPFFTNKSTKPTMPKVQANQSMPGINAKLNTEMEKSLFKKKIALYKEKIEKGNKFAIPEKIAKSLKKNLQKDGMSATDTPAARQYSTSVKIGTNDVPKRKGYKITRTKVIKPQSVSGVSVVGAV